MIRTGQLTVNSTPIPIDGVSVDPTRIHIHNNDATTHLVLGGSDVTLTTGLKLPKLDSVELTLNPGEQIWVMSGSGSIDISWLVQSY